MSSCDEWKPFLVMIAIDFAFAVVNILLKKSLQEGMNHLVFITYRLTTSSIFLAPIGYFWERQGRPRLTFRILCYLFLSAIVGASVTQYFFLLGIQYTSATFACAFINIVPVITFIMALPFGLESVNIKCNSGRAKILGTVIGKRFPCQYSSTAIMTFFGAIQSAALSLATGRNLSMWVLKGKMQIITVLFSGMVGSGLCFVGMSWCVKKRGPVFTAAFSPFVQIMAAMIDVPLLHEQLNLGSVLGSILVMLGLYILLWGKNRR
ncbi:hypothetical protein K1719_046922 [Acacia pycnantha]|nr:hypothetical protein K1719_046922 [Acacia pycnantha]